EAMTMFYGIKNKRAKNDPANVFFVDENIFAHTLDVLMTRAQPLGIEIVTGHWKTFQPGEKTFGVLLQYPNQTGLVEDYRAFAEKMTAAGVYVIAAADLLALALLQPPAEWGADCAVGTTQRFGIPMGYGGPHAAFFATSEKFKRTIPGRIIGVSVDSNGRPAYRMALQTREQHIRREKATSNICTAQALLAIMAGMYAAWHGPDGIKAIAKRVHGYTRILDKNLRALGFHVVNDHYFDTLCIETDEPVIDKIHHLANANQLNFYYSEGQVQISLDETTEEEDIDLIVSLFAQVSGKQHQVDFTEVEALAIPPALVRQSDYLTHPVFNTYHTETKMMRYIKRLENKDLSLTHSMIPLGSCTMKLNAATELLPVSWPEFAKLHPFVPEDQAMGYKEIFTELEKYLCEITGLSACSLQPNSGAQGEYTGLMVIRAYHQHRGEGHRNVTLIPASAHGTNPASAAMAGMKIIVVACDEKGNVDVDDLRAKAIENKENLAALMVTYPSTHGVFESAIKEICQIIHDNGGLVYMDGANMNAQTGLTSPGHIGADVCHLNLHKTFAIPHGGGGPGAGPICVNDKLASYLPGHIMANTGGNLSIHAVSAAPWGSAGILIVSYGYIRLLGKKGLVEATKYAILNANYMKARLAEAYPILYAGEHGRAAHELIVDVRPFKEFCSAEDIAKRLIDYGFHAPTLSFPVPGTLMIEPTESESKDELDRFCDAMLEIRKEIDEIASGLFAPKESPLHNAPHTAEQLTANEWSKPYSREKAAFPLQYLKEGYKFWPPVGRVDNAYGDRHLICTCPPMENYMEEEAVAG
ncbi:MAG TPA: glycine dehydrogenase (aminomethyl-transferring), partial [Bacteroidetes bacterium]|nr:glycine dehydrogenase (aminomethyl-transferring) [Bacteroidota bacterium]